MAAITGQEGRAPRNHRALEVPTLIWDNRMRARLAVANRRLLDTHWDDWEREVTEGRRTYREREWTL